MEFFCVKCKAKRNTEKFEKKTFKTKHGVKNAVAGVCPKCGTKMFKFVKA
jgi:predicted  nucleic acid-binding Zn-ribbon protein